MARCDPPCHMLQWAWRHTSETSATTGWDPASDTHSAVKLGAIPWGVMREASGLEAMAEESGLAGMKAKVGTWGAALSTSGGT